MSHKSQCPCVTFVSCNFVRLWKSITRIIHSSTSPKKVLSQNQVHLSSFNEWGCLWVTCVFLSFASRFAGMNKWHMNCHPWLEMHEYLSCMSLFLFVLNAVFPFFVFWGAFGYTSLCIIKCIKCGSRVSQRKRHVKEEERVSRRFDEEEMKWFNSLGTRHSFRPSWWSLFGDVDVSDAL